jgi:hypothetical protein
MTGCAVTHTNCVGSAGACGTGADAIGQSYFLATDSCAAPGTPGTDSSYSEAMAAAAVAAAPQPSTSACSDPPCVGEGSCPDSTTKVNVYYDDRTDTGGPCIVWAFETAGSGSSKTTSGYVHVDTTGCLCPTTSDPTWD